MKKVHCSSDTHRHEKLNAFDRLLTIMDELRENCPWDKKQTWDSLRHLTIEEVYELSDAILAHNATGIKEELGDVVLHIIFYARIAAEKKQFDISDVLHGICDKLVERHPHIYGNVDNDSMDAQTVKKNWEQIKLKKNHRSVLQGVPKSLPSIIKAIRIQDKVSSIGFDWSNQKQVWDKVNEEMRELQAETAKPSNTKKTQEELGDVLFSIINYARFIGINPDEALEQTNKKFVKRFQRMETSIEKAGKKISSMTLPEMDTYWEQVKKEDTK